MPSPLPVRRQRSRRARARIVSGGWGVFAPLVWCPAAWRPTQLRWLAVALRPLVGTEAPRLATQLQRESVTAGPSVLASAAGHLLLLAVLAWLVVTRPAPVDSGIDATWAAPDRPAPPGAVRIAAGPVEIKTVLPEEVEATPAGRVMSPEPTPEPPSAPQRGPVDVQRLLTDRSPERQAAALADLGDNAAVEQAIREGLKWLVRRQKSDGRWMLHQPYSDSAEGPGYPDAGQPNLHSDTAATALALLPLLGAGNTPLAGEHQQAVARGIQWLVGMQKSDGDLHDSEEFGRQTAYYAHGMATIALCEAYALSGDETLRNPCERAVAFLVASQNPVRGGWKYQPLTADNAGDLSVTGWSLMALHTARAANISVPPESFERAGQFLNAVQVAGGAEYKYMPDDPPSRASLALTAEGLLCRQYLGLPADDPAMLQGVAVLLSPHARPVWATGRRNVYGWYYTAQTLHQLGGTDWRDWYAAARDQIVPKQVRTGSVTDGRDVRGSWSPTPPGDPHEYAAAGGRLYVSAFCLLILQTPYRHASVYHHP